MRRPIWTKRKMPVTRSGYVKCVECYRARFLGNSKSRCGRHR